MDLRNKEVIEIFGNTDSGKSAALMSIIRAHLEDGAKFVVADMENGKFPMLLPYYPTVSDAVDSGQVKIIPIGKWEDTERLVENVMLLKAGDWFMADMFGMLWDYVDIWFDKNRWREPSSKHLVDELRKSNGDTGSLERVRVNKRAHNHEFRDRLVNESNAHFVVTTADQLIIKGVEKDELILEEFGSLGVKPDGEKRTSTLMKSLFHFAHVKDGKGHTRYKWLTVKDKLRYEVSPHRLYSLKMGWWEDYCNVQAEHYVTSPSDEEDANECLRLPM